MAAAFFAVEERAIWDGDAEHFFKTQRLGAELHPVAVVFFWFAAFVFDRQHGAVAVELDDVCFSTQAEPVRYDVQPACDADAVAGFVGAVVGFFVELVSLCGEMVFRPDLLEMDECALPLAEQEVLQCGEGEEVFWEIGDWVIGYCAFFAFLRLTSFSQNRGVLRVFAVNPWLTRWVARHHRSQDTGRVGCR
jgi:hypothetical protein